jgi:hypothetical protein
MISSVCQSETLPFSFLIIKFVISDWRGWDFVKLHDFVERLVHFAIDEGGFFPAVKVRLF